MTEALQLEIRTLKELLDSERDPAGRAFAPLADAYRKAGRVPEALRILRDGISKHPDFVTGHVVAAQLYVEQGLAAEGAIAARRALELDGENVSALRSLLRALDETGAAQEAEGVRSLLTTLEPDFTPDWAIPTTETGEETAEPAGAALAPTVALGSLRLEPAIEEPEALELETDAAAATLGDGMIDLASIGPIPSADIPGSALAPDLPPLDMTSPADSGLDFGLADLTMTAGETQAAGADEPMLGLPSLDPVAEDEPLMDLAMLAPSADDVVDDVVEDEPVMDLAMLAPSVDDVADPVVEDEPVMDLAMLAPDIEDEPAMDLAMLAPDVEDEPLMDLAMLAPSVDDVVDDVVEDEPVMDLAMLAPDIEDEPAMDLAMLAPDVEDEPVMDLAMLAPDVEEEPVMDLAMLAPDLEDEPAMDLALLAPDAEEEPVMDLAMLAPDVAPRSSVVVMDVAALAPMSTEIEEPVFDLASLAPSVEPDADIAGTPRAGGARPVEDAAVPHSMIPDEEPVFDLDALAPAAEADLVATHGTVSTGPAGGPGNGRMADEDASKVGFVSSPASGPLEPNEMVIDLDALRVAPTVASAGPLPSGPLEVEISAGAGSTPSGAVQPESQESAPDRGESTPSSESGTSDADASSDEQGEPMFTRTLAELYATQGAVKQAVSVLRHLLAENPGNEALSRRIAELESGAPIARPPRDEQPGALPGQDDEEVEALARELAESGRGSPETDSPFAWTDRESAATQPSGPTIREYFDGLLKWEPRDS